jgi:hypothetical protein
MSFKLGHASTPKRRIFLPLFLFCGYDSSVLQNFKIFTHLSKFSLSRHFEYANKQITYHFWLCVVEFRYGTFLTLSLFHLFFLILTCSCQYSYNLMLTSNCMCRPYIDTNNPQGMQLGRFKNRTPARFR